VNILFVGLIASRNVRSCLNVKIQTNLLIWAGKGRPSSARDTHTPIYLHGDEVAFQTIEKTHDAIAK
jgi:hypothetical protein